MMITALTILFRKLQSGETTLPANPPLTPGLQIFKWHGKSFNAVYDADEDVFNVVIQ